MALLMADLLPQVMAMVVLIYALLATMMACLVWMMVIIVGAARAGSAK